MIESVALLGERAIVIGRVGYLELDGAIALCWQRGSPREASAVAEIGISINLHPVRAVINGGIEHITRAQAGIEFGADGLLGCVGDEVCVAAAGVGAEFYAA